MGYNAGQREQERRSASILVGSFRKIRIKTSYVVFVQRTGKPSSHRRIKLKHQDDNQDTSQGEQPCKGRETHKQRVRRQREEVSTLLVKRGGEHTSGKERR